MALWEPPELSSRSLPSGERETTSEQITGIAIIQAISWLSAETTAQPSASLGLEPKGGPFGEMEQQFVPSV
eukprot:3228073-Pyramimonas_sp.AAC.1